MFRIILTIIITAILFGNVVSQQRKTSSINETMLKAHIKFLSDDMLEGRGTGARGGELAAKYIAAQLEALGAKGAGENGSFFQPVSLVGVKADPNTTLTNNQFGVITSQINNPRLLQLGARVTF